MKKLVSSLLAILLCVSVVGCKEKQDDIVLPTTTKREITTTTTTELITTETTEITLTTQAETISSTHATAKSTTLSAVSNVKYKAGKYPEYYYAKPLFEDSNFGAKKFDKKVFTRKRHKGYYFSKSKEGVAINKYSGNKKSIILPEKVDGKKVVRLAGYFTYEPGPYYFYQPTWNIRYITKVETMATEITLSRYIKYIEGAFGDVEKINVVPENEYYSSQDGALYSKDKKILYFVPPAMRDGFKIPDFVENVHYNAFFDTTKDIVISKNVKHFDSHFKSVKVVEENPYFTSINGSLYNKNATELIRIAGFKSYKMPESVEFVNNENAFYTRSAFYGENGTKEVYLGKNLNKISKQALKRLKYIEEYSVDENNKYFSAKNNVLFNRDKTQLYIISYFYDSDKYKVPETVEKINLERVYHSLENIHIGKNVKDISLNDDETGIWIKIHCYENSYAHKFAENNEIEYALKKQR